MHNTENKSLWKEEMNYGGDTWYMGRIYYEELKIYAYVWLSIFKSFQWTSFIKNGRLLEHRKFDQRLMKQKKLLH